MPARTRAFLAMTAVLASLATPVAASAHDELLQRTHGPDPMTGAAPVSAAASVASAPAGDWCPNEAPGANQVDNGDYRYHAVYVHPADRSSRLSTLGNTLEADAFGASALIERLYGRAIRFDVGTPCGRNQLDITELRLPYTQAQLDAFAKSGGTATFDAVGEALRQAGYGVAEDSETPEQLAARHENYLVWLDGPSPARSCGQGTALLDSTRSDTNLNNFGGKLAVIFRDGSDFCGADVVRHEIGHNLGALQPDAPNTSDGVHCNDAFEDTMCAFQAPKIVDGPFNGLYFDYRNDDYWDPPQGKPLGWWTLDLSRFICPTRDCNRPAVAERPAAEAAKVREKRQAAKRRRQARHRKHRRARVHKRHHRRGGVKRARFT